MKKLLITPTITQRDETLNAYLIDIRKYDLLSADEERTIAKDLSAIGKTRDEARRKLILHNLRLAVSIAKKYINMGVPLSDLVEMAGIGLCRAADLFDVKRNAKFASFASVYMRAEILDEIEKHGRMIATTHDITNCLSKYRALCDAMFKEEGRMPTSQEFADFAGITIDKAKLVVKSMGSIDSLDTPVGNKDDDDYTLGDTIEGGRIDVSAIDKDSCHEALVKTLKAVLNERDALAVMAQFGLIDMTLCQVAYKYSTDTETLRRAVERAIAKIQKNEKAMAALCEYRIAA